MPSRYIAIPLVVLLAVAFYWAFAYDDDYAFWVIPPVIALASLYVLEPQLNWWIWKRYPPDLRPGFRQLLEQHSAYYRRLDEGARREFRRRVFLFTQGNEFMPQAFEEVPEDIKVMIAAGAVQLTLGREDFLFPKFETIIVYPHPFPSPEYPEHWHGSELYEPDGALLFSAEHLTRAFIQEHLYLNLALYEYARAFRLIHTYPPPPDADTYPWEALERASGFSKEAIGRWIGLDDMDRFGVAAALFFSMPAAFARELPDAYAAFRAYFGQDPLYPPRTTSV